METVKGKKYKDKSLNWNQVTTGYALWKGEENVFD